MFATGDSSLNLLFLAMTSFRSSGSTPTIMEDKIGLSVNLP